MVRLPDFSYSQRRRPKTVAGLHHPQPPELITKKVKDQLISECKVCGFGIFEGQNRAWVTSVAYIGLVHTSCDTRSA